MSRKATTPETFWPQLDRVNGDDSCWAWTGSTKPNGYGQVSVRYRVVYTHRYAWECTYGPVPDGLFVLHKCDNRLCCNPAHLYLGTHENNMDDMVSRGRAVSGSRLHPELMPRGEQQPQTKLTEERVRALRLRHAAGATFTDLASEFGISPGNAHHVVHRKTWKHIA